MTMGAVANLSGALHGAVTIAGTPLTAPLPGAVKNLPAAPLKRFNPSLNGVVPYPTTMIPIKPLPGGGSTVVGVVGSPIDSG